MKTKHVPELGEVIRMSSFTVGKERYVYCSVTTVLPGLNHLMVINDGEEITVVTEEKNLEFIGTHEANKERWRLINIRCGNPFYCIGFIAAITAALSRAEIDVVLTSSYSKDLVMVMEGDLERAVGVLREEGFGSGGG